MQLVPNLGWIDVCSHLAMGTFTQYLLKDSQASILKYTHVELKLSTLLRYQSSVPKQPYLTYCNWGEIKDWHHFLFRQLRQWLKSVFHFSVIEEKGRRHCYSLLRINHLSLAFSPVPCGFHMWGQPASVAHMHPLPFFIFPSVQVLNLDYVLCFMLILLAFLKVIWCLRNSNLLFSPLKI